MWNLNRPDQSSTVKTHVKIELVIKSILVSNLRLDLIIWKLIRTILPRACHSNAWHSNCIRKGIPFDDIYFEFRMIVVSRSFECYFKIRIFAVIDLKIFQFRNANFAGSEFAVIFFTASQFNSLRGCIKLQLVTDSFDPHITKYRAA